MGWEDCCFFFGPLKRAREESLPTRALRRPFYARARGIPRRETFPRAAPYALAVMSHIPYLDRTLALVPQPGRVRAHIRGERLLVPAGDHRPAVERLYRRLARAEIAARLDEAVSSVGLAYKGLSIRSQRTRWASCSSSGAMSFNWRLLLGPERVLDYVVWHEVCHLEVPNHSSRFWELLEKRLPGFREPHAWLRRHGATLVL
jgi:predicted metal-dependent hydrolase